VSTHLDSGVRISGPPRVHRTSAVLADSQRPEDALTAGHLAENEKAMLSVAAWVMSPPVEDHGNRGRLSTTPLIELNRCSARAVVPAGATISPS